MKIGREVAFLTKSRFWLAVLFPHSVAAKSVYFRTLFVANYRKDFFMGKIFKFQKLTLKELCAVSMLMAITAILAIYCTFRIGNQIKIPLKFISVFITGFFFGPWIGGLCGAVGDILNILLVPVGTPLPALTLLEFVSGFIYGAFFYRQKISGIGYVLRCIICAILQFIIDMFLSSWVLVHAGIFPSFSVAFPIRLTAGIIKFSLCFAVLLGGCGYLKLLKPVWRDLR